MADSTGFDIGPLVTRYAETYGLPPALLLAMLVAESGNPKTGEPNPYAERWGDWPDVSFGCVQMTVQTAAQYGIGRGLPRDAMTVRQALFDRELAIDLGARHLRKKYDLAGGDWLQSLIAYNAGIPHPEGDWYWVHWKANVVRYQESIKWAMDTIGR